MFRTPRSTTSPPSRGSPPAAVSTWPMIGVAMLTSGGQWYAGGDGQSKGQAEVETDHVFGEGVDERKQSETTKHRNGKAANEQAVL